MPTLTLRARTLPYRPELRAHEKICTRCGIMFTVNKSRGPHNTECRDCR